jgi:hypothetical protein
MSKVLRGVRLHTVHIYCAKWSECELDKEGSVEASVEGGLEGRRCAAINPPICMRRNPREYLERNISV